MSAVKYLCVVNLRGPHKPRPVRKNARGQWWDKTGNYSWDGGKCRDGYAEWLFDRKSEADAWYLGARAVCDQMARFCK